MLLFISLPLRWVYSGSVRVRGGLRGWPNALSAFCPARSPGQSQDVLRTCALQSLQLPLVSVWSCDVIARKRMRHYMLVILHYILLISSPFPLPSISFPPPLCSHSDYILVVVTSRTILLLSLVLDCLLPLFFVCLKCNCQPWSSHFCEEEQHSW